MRTTIDLDDALLHRVMLRALDEAPSVVPKHDEPRSCSMGPVREGYDLVKAR